MLTLSHGVVSLAWSRGQGQGQYHHGDCSSRLTSVKIVGPGTKVLMEMHFRLSQENARGLC